MSEQEPFKHWGILELMGHVKVAGLITEEERFGSKVGRIDIPQGDVFVTQYFGGSSVYRLTPCTEEIARAIAKNVNHAPVYEWDLRRTLGLIEAKEKAKDPYFDHDEENEYDDEPQEEFA